MRWLARSGSRFREALVAAAAVACGVGLLDPRAEAQTTYYWAPTGTFANGGAGTWSASNAWRTGSSTGAQATYADGANTVIFGGTASGTIAIASIVQVNTIRLDPSTTSGVTVTLGTTGSSIEFVGGSAYVYGTPGRTLQLSTGQTGTFTMAAGGTLAFDGGGTINPKGVYRPSGTTTVIVTNTTTAFFEPNGSFVAGSGNPVGPIATIVNTGTLGVGAAYFTSPITLGTNSAGGAVISNAGGGTLRVNNSATGGTRLQGANATVTVGGTSTSKIIRTGASYSFITGSSTTYVGQFTVNATGDPSGIDLDYQDLGWRQGTIDKLGAGTMRLTVGGTFNNFNDFTTYLNTGTALRVSQGTFINNGVVKSIANVAGGLLTTTSTAGTFDQVNVTSGTFEIARSSGLFSTLSGTTYAAGNNALNLRGGTLRYSGVNADYSGMMGSLGGVGSTIDTNGQTVTFATGLTGTGGLSKAGAGTLILDGVNAFTGTTTVNAGGLRIGGAVAGAVSVAFPATLEGTGTFAGLSGAGLVAPGNSPGILTGTGALNPSGGLDFALEISGTLPVWSNASASVNDVLRIMDPTAPFTAALATGVNTVSVYLDVAALSTGTEYLGGFFTDRSTGLLADVQGADWAFYVSGTGGGAVTYNGTNYYALNDWLGSPQNTGGVTGISVGVRTVASADFFGGTVTNGQVTAFVVVPEPATVAGGVVGLAVVAWAARRRRMGGRHRCAAGS